MREARCGQLIVRSISYQHESHDEMFFLFLPTFGTVDPKHRIVLSSSEGGAAPLGECVILIRLVGSVRLTAITASRRLLLSPKLFGNCSILTEIPPFSQPRGRLFSSFRMNSHDFFTMCGLCGAIALPWTPLVLDSVIELVS
jgi:hypothetical protein